jgi:argininosuccinate synthase
MPDSFAASSSVFNSSGVRKKVVLAYSGGLDTSIILKWLQTDLWLRGRDLHRRSGPGRGAGAGARQGRADGHQAENIFIEDLREEFVRDYVFPMFRANALYEGQYLLGTSIARPLIAKRRSRSRARPAPMRSPWRDRQGQRPGPLRAVGYYALDPTSRSSRRGANGISSPRPS